jgi:hypothetical protein
MEIVNPLKARRVAEVVQSLPERLRLHPGALARVLELKGPDVPFATRPAATLPAVLEFPEVCEAIATRLCSDTAYRLYDSATVDEVVTALLRPPAPTRRANEARMRAMLPRKFKDVALAVVGVRLDAKELALRMLVAARAVELFEGDVERIGPSPFPSKSEAVPARAGGLREPSHAALPLGA